MNAVRIRKETSGSIMAVDFFTNLAIIGIELYLVLEFMGVEGKARLIMLFL